MLKSDEKSSFFSRKARSKKSIPAHSKCTSLKQFIIWKQEKKNNLFLHKVPCKINNIYDL